VNLLGRQDKAGSPDIAAEPRRKSDETPGPVSLCRDNTARDIAFLVGEERDRVGDIASSIDSG